MKIIKKGTKTLPNEIIYIIKCRTCGCKFTYNKPDITYIGYDGIRAVACPQCEYYCHINFKKKYKGGEEERVKKHTKISKKRG